MGRLIITSKSISFKALKKNHRLFKASVAVRTSFRGVCRGVYSTLCYGLLKDNSWLWISPYLCWKYSWCDLMFSIFGQLSTRTRKIYNQKHTIKAWPTSPLAVFITINGFLGWIYPLWHEGMTATNSTWDNTPPVIATFKTIINGLTCRCTHPWTPG